MNKQKKEMAATVLTEQRPKNISFSISNILCKSKSINNESSSYQQLQSNNLEPCLTSFKVRLSFINYKNIY